MPDKGNAMSQTYYEKQGKIIKLYQEAFGRNEMTAKEAVVALRMIGFSETMAARHVNEWAAQFGEQVPETEKEKKRRLKEKASLEKYLLRMKLGNKYYLRLKYRQNELSKEETVKKLIRSGCKEDVAKSLVDDWEAEK